MNGQYPRFKNFYFYEELTEHFLLTKAELNKNVNNQSFFPLQTDRKSSLP
jgi:hypothetical protein